MLKRGGTVSAIPRIRKARSPLLQVANQSGFGMSF
jgi:hypothetical protein